MSSMTRSILRYAARARMEEAGKTHIRKKKYNTTTGKKYSLFSKDWKAYAPHKVEEKAETETEA